MSLLTAWTVSPTPRAEVTDASIERARSYAAGKGGIGLLVHQGGRLRREWYAPGHGRDRARHVYSGTKSFIGVLAVMAVEDGWLDLDEPVSRTLPSWRWSGGKRVVTVRQLLDFTSGLESGFEEIYAADGRDKLLQAVRLRVIDEPGSVFRYGPGHLQVFGEVLRRKRKGAGSWEDDLEDRLLGPLGIEPAQWRRDAHGNRHLTAGTWLTGREWLRFGEFLLAEGAWEGRQLVPADRLRLCFQGSAINPAYGLTFWLNAAAADPRSREVDVEEWLAKDGVPTDWRGVCLCKRAPPDLVAALGSNGQRLYVVPSHGLAVVVQGRGGGFRDAAFLGRMFGS